MIFPVAVTVKRFLALEFVFTLGILPSIKIIPLRRSPPGDPCRTSSGNIRPGFGREVDKELPNLLRISGCKDNGAANSSKVYLKQIAIKFNVGCTL